MTEAEEYDKRLLERISMFSDAVYAIVLTILVLELHLPELVHPSSLAEMMDGIRDISPKLYAFFLSVLIVGGNWISSVNLQKVVVKTNRTYILLSVTYLIIISLFPFSCTIVGNYPNNPGSYLIFGVLGILMAGNTYFWMRSILKNKLLHQHADYQQWGKMMNILPFFIIFLIGVSFSAFISTTLSFLLFIIVNVFPFFLTRSMRIHHKDNQIL